MSINNTALNIHLFVQHVSKSLWCTMCHGAYICSCYLMPIILHMRKLKNKEITKLLEGRGGFVHSDLSVLRLYLDQTSSPKPLVFLFAEWWQIWELLWIYPVTDHLPLFCLPALNFSDLNCHRTLCKFKVYNVFVHVCICDTFVIHVINLIHVYIVEWLQQ